MMEHGEKETSLLIASPNAAFRRHWSQGIELRYALREVGQRSELEQRLAGLHPDILLLDLAMCEPEGTAAVSAFQRLSPSTKILLVTATPDVTEGMAALKVG